ncbi:GntR family transcriptional regulator [Kitasatospora sp. NPDC094015]|uniref:GntR family transcriptional regulator n=1 Tax=Kitasatospora sp. NPDC094015 TaxID=3155205 RepID=UPI003321F366
MAEQHTERTAPAYLSIAADLRRAILEGAYPPGRNLPSERGLAARYGVHRQTARAALRHLCDQGLALGDLLGTYVLAGPNRRPAAPRPLGRGPGEGFPGLLLHPGRSATAAGLLRTGAAPPVAARALGLPAGTRTLTYRHEVRQPDGGLAQCSRSWFAPALVARVPQLAALAAAAGSARRPDGAPADLGDLFAWTAMAGLRVQTSDGIHLSCPGGADHHPAGSPCTLTIRRTVTDQQGLAVVVTEFEAAAHGVSLSYPARPEPAHGPRPSTAPVLRLSLAELGTLRGWATCGSPDRGLALRARIVLACGRASVEQVARELEVSAALVRAWRGRFQLGGPAALDGDRVRPAR